MRTARIISISLVAVLLTGCSSWHLAQADKAMDRLAYADAMRHYAHVAEGKEDRIGLLHAGEAAYRMDRMQEAAARFAGAGSSGPLPAKEALLYGRALLTLGRTADAGRLFAQVVNERPEDREARSLLISAQLHDDLALDNGAFTVAPIDIPGVTAAFGACHFGHGLVFAGEHDPGLTQANPWNGRSFLDLYSTEQRPDGSWTTATPIPGSINGRYHEGPAVFTSDGGTLFFTRSNYYRTRLLKDDASVSHLMIFRATLDGKGDWGDIHDFPYNGENFSVGHPALNPDGTVLYFSSDMPGGEGGSDIWRSENHGFGWEPPVNLGPAINTPGNELFPTTAGESLYFASTGHVGLGGLDIFETHPEEDGWSSPHNLGAPINTAYDDLGYLLDADGLGGYLSSNRSGADRILRFTVNAPVFDVAGLITGPDGTGLMQGATVTLTNTGSGRDTSVVTGPDGSYDLPLEPGANYELKASMKGMLTQSRSISTGGLSVSRTFREDVRLKPKAIDQTMTVNIFFDFGQWDILPTAAVELDKLVRMINDNPQVSFELSAHTDCRGDAMYNLLLSDARAHATEDYLIRHGADPTRITSKGYGEERPVNHCRDGVSCTEEEHQENRRTELKVTGIKELASSVP